MPLHLTRIEPVTVLPDPAGLPEGYPVLYGGRHFTVKDAGFKAVGGHVFIVPTSGVAHEIDVIDGGIIDITLTDNCAFTIVGATTVCNLRLYLRQDGVGSRIPSFPAAVQWAGAAPTFTATAGALDVIDLETIDGTNWIATVVGLDFS